jgi:RNA polymerase sigma-70 factor (ECF subfamily)
MHEQHVTAAWQTHHAYLVDLAFRMLGDIGHAEDVAQEAFTRLARATPGEIEDERGWLTVVTSRLCLDQIRSAHARHEYAEDVTVLDATNPVTAPDPADRITLDDDVRLALFVVLQRLSPAERVAFVLHDVFRTPFDTIATTLGRPVGTCRQLARRARAKIAELPGRPRDVADADHRLVTERFITACANGDVAGLLAVLDPDVWGVAEFGAALPIPSRTEHGAEAVAGRLVRFWSDRTLVSYPVPGAAAVLAFVDGSPFALITLTVAGDRITRIDLTADPAVIARVVGPTHP